MKITTIAAAGVLGLAATFMIPVVSQGGSGNAWASDSQFDAALTTRVKAAFAAESALNSLDIHVETVDGVVTLSGEVDNEAHVARAEQVALSAEGVTAVNNELRAAER